MRQREAEAWMRRCQVKLGLQSWTLALEVVAAFDDVTQLGECVFDDVHDKAATVRVKRGMSYDQTRNVIAHEVAHVLLAEGDEYTCNRVADLLTVGM